MPYSLPYSASWSRFLFQFLGLITLFLLLVSNSAYSATKELASWKNSEAKQAILAFVQTVTDVKSKDFVPESERIAVFDNDGTLWSEQPMYFQLAFAMDRIRSLSEQHPEWKTQQPFKAVLEKDMPTLIQSGEKGLLQLIAASHANMSTDEFQGIVLQWIKSAQHPRFKRAYTDLVYQPMLELLLFLRQNGFKTYIVSGGGIEFMRAFSQTVYGIPPEQVIGSTIKTQFSIENGKPMIRRLPEIDFVDDKAGKPLGIHRHIGRRPIAAFGNSDGDLQMLQWSASGQGRTLQMLIQHTDALREWAYDKNSHIGQLDKALIEAKQQHWSVVDMKKDWKAIYPFQTK